MKRGAMVLGVVMLALLAGRGAGGDPAGEGSGGTRGTAAKRDGNFAYVVPGLDGRFYAKSVPEKNMGTKGTTKVYRVGMDGDELLDSYDWYAPKQFQIGMELGWSPIAGKIAVIRMHDEPEALADDRVELSFYIGGKFLKSYTVKELVALGMSPLGHDAGKKGEGMREWVDYRVAGWELGRKPNEYFWSIVMGDGKKVLFDPLTGEVAGDAKDK